MGKPQLIDQLHQLGINIGDTIMVHASLKALGDPTLSPLDVIESLTRVVGSSGTLLVPALSYEQTPKLVHNTLLTPTNVGIIPETFRKMTGVARSIHPTHSVCGLGKAASFYLSQHHLDNSPCGENSPFRKILFNDAKILMLGCGLKPNTAMHAVEEILGTPYLFGDIKTYQIINADGVSYFKDYQTHGFNGWSQRYDRIIDLKADGMVAIGKTLKATSYLINAQMLRINATDAIKKDPFFFVEAEKKT
jgi:aminoglycoside 3-N-acetyltransferase